MKVELNSRQLAYLLGKTRQDILNRRRQLSRVVQAPDQEPADFEDFQAMLQNALDLRESTYRALGGNPEALR